MHKLDEDIILSVDLEPLVESIRNKNAVVYVGAGASKAAGLPDWETFLFQCLEKAKKSFNKNAQSQNSINSFRRAEELLKKGDFLMSAELLQQEIGSTLSSYIWEAFGTKRITTEVHRAIARIPFSLAVTTNYDKLLEGAYSDVPNVFTWLDPQAIFSSIKNNRFAVIKTHGDVGNNPSLVLTRTHYRNLMHYNKAFNDELTYLLSLKTFLFIGSSLRDTDLLRVMDDAKLTYESNFGPHYAFLFEDELDESFKRYLRDAYNINVIVSKANNANKTNSLCSFLKVLSGRVSELNRNSQDTIMLQSEFFNFNKVIKSKMLSILQQTGADRGLVAFIDRRDLPGLKHVVMRSAFGSDMVEDHILRNNSNFDIDFLIHNDSLLSKFYSKCSKERRFLYYSDVTKPHVKEPNTNIQKWEYDIANANIHSETKSILITQIFSEGQTVGVIMVESSIMDAFTSDHLHTLQKNTDLLGATFRELELRNSPLLEINIKDNVSLFQELMEESYLLKNQDISYLLYEIDHREGRLLCYCDPKVNAELIDKPFYYNFKDKSLATYVFHKQQEVYFKDVNEGISKNKIAEEGVRIFNINGPIYATPIKVGKYNSFILVAWSRKPVNTIPLLDKFIAPITTLAHLIANSIENGLKIELDTNNCSQFILSINKHLKPIDRNKPWTKKILFQADSREKIYVVLIRALTEKYCGIARVRLWHHNVKDKDFECIYSYSLERDGKTSEENKYTGLITPESDPYCKYTLDRYMENVNAMHQHKSMFAHPDPNYVQLDKDPDGKWIVGPIVNAKSKELLGFISADNHYINSEGLPKEINTYSERKDAFQRYAVDLIADLLIPIFRSYNIDKYKDSSSRTERI